MSLPAENIEQMHEDVDRMTREFLASNSGWGASCPWPREKPKAQIHSIKQSMGKEHYKEDREIALEIRKDDRLKTRCEVCENMICLDTGALCEQAEDIVNQDYVHQTEKTQTELLDGDLGIDVDGVEQRNQWAEVHDGKLYPDDVDRILNDQFQGVKLTEMERRVLTMQLGDFSNQLIAQLLGSTENSVKVILSRVRKKAKSVNRSH
jgi:DNA-binding CsgD family transcriptional regulator